MGQAKLGVKLSTLLRSDFYISISYPDWEFLWFFSVPSHKRRDITSRRAQPSTQSNSAPLSKSRHLIMYVRNCYTNIGVSCGLNIRVTGE